MYIISETVQKQETDQCTNIDELKNKVQIVHTLTDADLLMSLNAAFSYAETFMSRKLQRTTVQLKVQLDAYETGTLYMRYGNTSLDFMALEDGSRLEHMQNYKVERNKLTVLPSNEQRIIVINYSCGFSTQRNENKVPDDVICGILMRAGAFHQVKTDVTMDTLKRAAICSDDLFAPYKLHRR